MALLYRKPPCHPRGRGGLRSASGSADPVRRLAAALLALGLWLAAGADVRADEPASADDLEASIAQGVAFLVADQNPNGSWGSARRTKGLNIYAPVPGAHDAFRLAVTAMAVAALIESGHADAPGAPAEALERGAAYLSEHLPAVRRGSADTLYNVWTHGYALKALALLHARTDDETERAALVALVNQQIDRLARDESVDGGWGYYDFRVGAARPASSSTSFTTATCLVTLRDVAGIEGVEVPERLVRHALDSIQRQRKGDHSYFYGEYLWSRPLHDVNRPAGSLARSQACNHALRLYGDGTVSDEVIEEWLDRLWERNGWLDIGRKRPVPHEAWFAIAGYFFYYGHYYAALVLDHLPPEARPRHREELAAILLPLQEQDGSWWDFPFYSYHQPYGTAYAIMSLARCRAE